MLPIRCNLSRAVLILALLVCAGAPGCMHSSACHDAVPTEASRVTQPPYTISAPDILLINAGNLVPLPPYLIGSLDILAIKVTVGEKRDPLVDNEPINGLFSVTPEGRVDLGFTYGFVPLVGMTMEQARKAIDKHLLVRFKGPLHISVDLAQSNQALQQIRGEHLVRPDGTVGLGIYGSVNVDGMTIELAKQVIEAHLGQYLQNPKISLDVAGFNSQVYYVITDLAGAGQRVFRLPVTGKETVLDAIAQIYGLSPVSSKHHIWVARPGRTPEEKDMTLKVDWQGITKAGETKTNYQLTTGDRVYVMGAPLVTFDTYLARVLSPIERALGVTLLGSSTYNSIAFPNGGTTNGTGR